MIHLFLFLEQEASNNSIWTKNFVVCAEHLAVQISSKHL
jgi:hypothetical protein